MTDEERIEAAYQHSIIQYFSSSALTNASLRQRFKMHDKQSPQISKLINLALQKGRVKPRDTETESRKFAAYIPYWA